MRKKITCLMMALFVCVSVLSGCSLVTLNSQSYYEATVATITYSDGTVDTISKRELLMGYNSYGYNYVDNYGYTTEEAIKTTLETIIETHLTIKEVKDYYAESGEELLTAAETTYLWDETLDAVYENLKDYFYEIDGTTIGDEEDDEDTSNNIFQEYERTAELYVDADGNYKIKKLETSTSIRETYTARYVEINGDKVAYDFENEYFQEVMYNKLKSYVTTTTMKSALAEYISDVKDNYSYKTFDSDEDCMMFELNRVYEILRDNYLVEKYTVIYNTAEYGDGTLAGVTVNDILEYYSAQVRMDYTDYVINGDTESFESDILSDVGSVYYIPQTANATQYFYVAYIKIEYTDEQIADYKELTSDAYTNEAYTAEKLSEFYAGIKVSIADAEDGSATTDTISATSLLSAIKSDLSKVNSASEAVEKLRTSLVKAAMQKENVTTESALSEAALAEIEAELAETSQKVAQNADYSKADAFRDYLYLYNDDDSLKNADYNYVFGVTTDGKVLSSDFTDEDDVNDAILALYNEGQAEVGDISDVVYTDDAAYIFFYAGKITNLFEGIDVNFDAAKNQSNITILASTRLNIFSTKTIFDSLYSSLASSNFTTFQNMDMNRLRSKAKSIEINGSEIEDLY